MVPINVGSVVVIASNQYVLLFDFVSDSEQSW